jgi:hypothetical protein
MQATFHCDKGCIWRAGPHGLEFEQDANRDVGGFKKHGFEILGLPVLAIRRDCAVCLTQSPLFG